MPRNGSGTYTVPNSFSSGNTIQSSEVNANFSDVGTEITGSLPRNGEAGMTGQLKAASGTVSTPGISFSSDTDTGFYRKSGNTIGLAIGGVNVADFKSTGIEFKAGYTASVSGTGNLHHIPTGTGPVPYMGSTAPTGWIFANGLTIGNASSGATGRANADTEDLFTLLWNTFANAQLAVSGGRGASAAADYAANKTIALPDLRGRGLFGSDTMGTSAASRLTSGGSGVDGATLGATGGSQTHTLTTSEMPAHTHTGTTSTAGAHTHSYTAVSEGAHPTGSGRTDPVNSFSSTTGSAGNHNHTFTTNSTGSGGAHNNMPPAFVSNMMIKL